MASSDARVQLAHLPTPLERCDRLTETLGGPEVWVKRDDCTGLGMGGNKVRKLEFLLGAARAEAADTVVTFGALQSNHARQTAAACARLGLRCILVLTRTVDRSGGLYDTGGNRLLDELLGAEVVEVADDAEALLAQVSDLDTHLRDQGARVRWIPPGGSDVVGALGYVAAAGELIDQERGRVPTFTDVVVATSTGGTQAGLVVGLERGGRATGREPPTVHGVAVFHDADRTRATVRGLVAEVAAHLGEAVPPDGRVVVTDTELGPGYGQPTAAMREAVARFARTEGLVLDPVYSGKAAAALVDAVRTGRIGAGRRVLFWHTGGAPGLFAYGRDVLPAGP